MIQLVSDSPNCRIDLNQNIESEALERRCACGHIAKPTDTTCRRCCKPLGGKPLAAILKYRHRVTVNTRLFFSTWRVLSQPGEAVSAVISDASKAEEVWKRRDPSLARKMFDARRAGDLTYSQLSVDERPWLQQLSSDLDQFCNAQALLVVTMQQIDGFQDFCELQEERPRGITVYFAHRNREIWSSRRRLARDEWIQLVDDEARKVEVARARLREPNNSVDGNQSTRLISAEVRRDVWRRDGARCATCGSQERLEFDHIIPVAMGGSNTARNIQLLCESCNRAKGATLG